MLTRSSTRCLIFLPLFAIITSTTHHKEAAHKKSPLEKSGVVTDVLDTDPGNPVQVRYGNLSVNFGNNLTPKEVEEAPTSISWDFKPTKLYTLAMVDPDAPSRVTPILREFRHWLVVNVPGNDLSKGQTCSGYTGAGPPMGSGDHRYVFAVFEQPAKLEVESKLCDQSGFARGRWSIKKFAKKFNLGQPMAANFFLSKYSG